MRQLRAENLSLRQVAAVLDQEGHRPRKAARWSAETVSSALARTG